MTGINIAMETSKNTLHTYGCSFTAPYNGLDKHKPEVMKGYAELHGGTYPPIWPEIVAGNYQMNLKNHGVGGADNDTILSRVTNSTRSWKEGDIVIVQWSHMTRFSMAVETDIFNGKPASQSYLFPINPSTNVEKLNIFGGLNESIKTYMLSNRQQWPWCERLIENMHIIQHVAELLKVRLYFWPNCPLLHDYILNNVHAEQQQLNKFKTASGCSNIFACETENQSWDLCKGHNFGIEHETGGRLKDNHNGKAGHEHQSEYIINYINSN